MRFARIVFLVAGIYGVLVITPMYFLEDRIGRDTPPAITHPEYFYGFLGVALTWQFLFLVLSTDPARYRAMILPSVLEKVSYGIALVILFAQHRLPLSVFTVGSMDWIFAVLFIAAYVVTRPDHATGGATMKIRVLACCVVASLFAIAPGAMFAHHGAAAYDLQKSITRNGTVTSFDWINPHCLLHFDASNDAGKVQHWTIQLYDPLWLARAGWNQTSLKPGDPITITFHAAKNGAPNGYFRDEDGKLTSNGKQFMFHLPGDDRIK